MCLLPEMAKNRNLTPAPCAKDGVVCPLWRLASEWMSGNRDSPLMMNLLNLFFHWKALVYTALNADGQQMGLASHFHAGDTQQKPFILALPDHLITDG